MTISARQSITPEPVLSVDTWPTNGHLIADCARLGYLRAEWRTLDPTYGEGVFWSVWRPATLIASDINPAKSPVGYSVDFRALPYMDRSFEAVVFDPPYKLNGTDQGEGERFGVEAPTTRDDRLELIVLGVRECARVLRDGYLLVKCQDQVNGGKVRWQTDLVTAEARACGLGKVDRFDFIGGRPQDPARGQKHARHNSSQLLVLKRGW